MNTRLIVFALLLTAVPQTMAEEPIRIWAQGSKPMMDICVEISNLFHWRITYEDPPVLDLREVVRELAPSGVPWLRTRAVPVSFEMPIMRGEPLQEYRRKVMDLVIGAYAGSGNRAAFRYTEDAEYIHVTPRAVAGPDGESRPFESILSNPVTIPRGRYTLGQLVSSIVAQVGNRAGTHIALGNAPNNIFASAMVTEEASNEPADQVLMRAFDEINGPRYASGVPPVRMYWVLTFMADGPQYFFSVHVSPAEFDDATIARRSQAGGIPAPVAEGPAMSGFIKPPK